MLEMKILILNIVNIEMILILYVVNIEIYFVVINENIHVNVLFHFVLRKFYTEEFEDTKGAPGYSESVNRRRTDNTMAKRVNE